MKKKDNQLSLELQILVESIRVVLLNEPHQHFIDLIKLPEVDWDRLKNMVTYHRIRPVFYEACRRVGFSSNYVNELAKFTRMQVMSGLTDKFELANVIGLLQENQIVALPYKGLLFSEKLYDNLALRESCDIDIIVNEESAKKGLKILLDAGYEIRIDNSPNLDFSDEELMDTLLKKTPGRELNLYKKQQINVARFIDYHWAINEKFREHHIDLVSFFKDVTLEEFGKKQILTPNEKGIFKMLLNHHGGRDCWTRLKDICDLLAYKNKYECLDLETLSGWSSEMQMKKTFEMGMYLCQTIIDRQSIPVYSLHNVSEKIIKFWEESIHLSESKQTFKYFFVYSSLQDKKLSFRETIKLMIRAIAFPNFIEHKRLIVFPDKYILLNAFAKGLSFLYYRVLKRKQYLN